MAKNSRTPKNIAPAGVECRCSGDPREMGLTQGTELREKILGPYQSLRNLEAFRLEQPWWLPYPFFLKLAESKSEKSLVAALRQSNPAMLARMQGIAEGAGLPLGSVCLMNAMEAFIASVEGRTVVPPSGACSALAVRGARSRTGEPIIAKNFDYLPLFQRSYMLRESRPRGGFCSLDFAVAPQAGTVDGVNEKRSGDCAQLCVRDRLSHAKSIGHHVDRRCVGLVCHGDRGRPPHHGKSSVGSGNTDARGCFRGPGFGGTLQYPCRCPPPRRGRRLAALHQCLPLPGNLCGSSVGIGRLLGQIAFATARRIGPAAARESRPADRRTGSEPEQHRPR